MYFDTNAFQLIYCTFYLFTSISDFDFSKFAKL